VDPLAEIYPHITPYAYCLNNPVRNIDKKGERPSEAGGVPAQEENGVWTTAQSTTYTPVVVYGQTSSTQEPDQANGSWIYGMNDSEDGVQTTAANHEAPIDPSDMNGTESWVPGLLGKLKEIFKSGKTPEKKQEPVQEPTVNQPEAVEQPDTVVETEVKYDQIPVGKAPNSRIFCHHYDEDTLIITIYKDGNTGKIIQSDTTKRLHK